LNIANLLVDDVLVAWEVVPGAEYADGSWKTFAVLHVRKKEGVGWLRVVASWITRSDSVMPLPS